MPVQTQIETVIEALLNSALCQWFQTQRYVKLQLGYTKCVVLQTKEAIENLRLSWPQCSFEWLHNQMMPSRLVVRVENGPLRSPVLIVDYRLRNGEQPSENELREFYIEPEYPGLFDKRH